jgi:cupin fold WbuC family metalloprotein
MRLVDEKLIQQLKQKARKSDRKRANYNFHQSSDLVQRMVNVMVRGAYVRPHKHEDPDKSEHFVILEGRVSALEFNSAGKVVDKTLLDSKAGPWAVDILPKVYHSFLVLSDEAVLMEFIQGPYDPDSHKKFASFAPEEGSDEVDEYMSNLENTVGA